MNKSKHIYCIDETYHMYQYQYIYIYIYIYILIDQ